MQLFMLLTLLLLELLIGVSSCPTGTLIRRGEGQQPANQQQQQQQQHRKQRQQHWTQHEASVLLMESQQRQLEVGMEKQAVSYDEVVARDFPSNIVARGLVTSEDETQTKQQQKEQTSQQQQQPQNDFSLQEPSTDKKNGGSTTKNATKAKDLKQGVSNGKPKNRKKPATNVTATNLDDGTPNESPSKPPTKKRKPTGSKSANQPTTPPVALTDAPTANDGSREGGNENEDDYETGTKPTKATSSPSQSDIDRGYQNQGTDTPSVAPIRHDEITKYPEKNDEGSHKPDDEDLKPPKGDDDIKSKATNMDEELSEDKDVAELEGELKREEKEARRIGGAGIGLALVAMIFTAYQMSENPDGIYASCCRLIITLVGCAFKIVLMPCRSIFGGSRHYGHMPVNTMDYGYREPYSNVELS